MTTRALADGIACSIMDIGLLSDLSNRLPGSVQSSNGYSCLYYTARRNASRCRSVLKFSV